MKLFLVRLAFVILPGLFMMLRVAVLGLPRAAPAYGLEIVSVTVSLPSNNLSLVIGTATVFELSPEAKETVVETAV